jgi:hypothetical protein
MKGGGMKAWKEETEKLLELVAEAEGSLLAVTRHISTEDSLLGLLWDGVVNEAMPEGYTPEGMKEALTSLRDELCLLFGAMKREADGE